MGRRGHRGVLEILRRLNVQELRPEEIGLHERRACVTYLRLEGYTRQEIADIFKVHPQTITRDEKANRKELAKLVTDIDVQAVAGGLAASAKHLYGKAMKEKDYALAWRIEREVISDLQSMGYLPKAAEQHQVHISTFTDLGKLAVQEEQAAIGATIPKGLPEPAPADEGEQTQPPEEAEKAEAPQKPDEHSDE